MGFRTQWIVVALAVAFAAGCEQSGRADADGDAGDTGESRVAEVREQAQENVAEAQRDYAEVSQKASEQVADAQREASETQAAAARKLAEEKAEADREVALARCKAMKGDESKACRERADADYEVAVAKARQEAARAL